MNNLGTLVQSSSILKLETMDMEKITNTECIKIKDTYIIPLYYKTELEKTAVLIETPFLYKPNQEKENNDFLILCLIPKPSYMHDTEDGKNDFEKLDNRVINIVKSIEELNESEQSGKKYESLISKFDTTNNDINSIKILRLGLNNKNIKIFESKTKECDRSVLFDPNFNYVKAIIELNYIIYEKTTNLIKLIYTTHQLKISNDIKPVYPEQFTSYAFSNTDDLSF